MRSWITRVASGLLLVGLIVACFAYWAYRQTLAVPDFYQRARAAVPADPQKVSRQLEQQVERLQEDVQREGGWRAEFTDEQINAWLVSVLPGEYPRLLPKGVDDPRVVIETNKILAAARYKNKHIDTIVSFELKIELTEQPNVLAVRMENLRAGALPLPISRFATGISREAAKSDIEVLWDKESLTDSPVALVTVPSDHKSYVHTPVIIESVGLNDGVLSMSGRTGPGALQAFQPQGPVYQLAALELIGYVPSPSIERSIQSSSRSRSNTNR